MTALSPDDLAPLLQVVYAEADSALHRTVLRIAEALTLDERSTLLVAALRRAADDAAVPSDLRSGAGPARSLRSVASIALAQAGPAPTPAEVAPPTDQERARAAALAEVVRGQLLATTGFPLDLAPLAALPTQDARILLSGLIAVVLTAPVPARERALARLVQVAITIRGPDRDILGDLPVATRRLASRQFGWAGRLLPLVEPAQILAALTERLTEADPAERMDVVNVLARAVEYLGRVQVPIFPASLAALAALARVLQPPAPRPVRRDDAVGWSGSGIVDEEGYELGDVVSRDWAGTDPGLGDLPGAPGPPSPRPARTGAPRAAPPPPARTGAPRAAPPPPVRMGAPRAAAPPPPAAPAAPQTRTAQPLLDAPDRVKPGAVFELRAGLSDTPSPGVVQPAELGLRVPTGSFTLTIKLLVDGFRILGAPATVELPVTPDDPYPYQVLRLVAQDDPGLATRRVIVAAYLIGEQVVGVAFRPVLVSADDPAAARTGSTATHADPTAQVQAVDAPALDERADGTATVPAHAWILDPAAEHVPDLQILVVSGNYRTNRKFSWLFHSPHADVPSTADWLWHGTDDGAAEWARTRIRGIQGRKDRPDLPEYLFGIGKEVRRLIPPQLWDALRAAGRGPASPTVLLGTADPYIPWELALLPDDWKEPYGEVLGGYAAVGRWIYDAEAPTPAPPARLDAGRMAVVSGTYQGSRRLKEAEEEAQRLTSTWSAATVNAVVSDVLACLKADPPYDIVHFAVHGNFDVTETTNGILMVDGEYLSPVSVSGVPPTAIRLVFLNACQLGQAQALLGESCGMVPSFLGIGAKAAIAPLWKVDDAVAREIALNFYTSLRNGESPAEYLRRARRDSIGREGQPYGTRLAYLYFGHPRLAVTWRSEENGSG